ncbi:MAG: hypothetical protein CMO81_03020 [Waddliaceae bacterium]|nr:hypothetical protein [Waddliaceae bacterium]
MKSIKNYISIYVFLILSAIMAATGYFQLRALYYTQYDDAVRQAKFHFESRFNHSEEKINRVIEGIFTLSRKQELRNWLEEISVNQEEEQSWAPLNSKVEKLLMDLISNDGNIHKLRILDLNGEEKLKIVREFEYSTPTLDSDFHNQKDYSYFYESTQLPQDFIYLSPITLNREFGKIQIPPVPVIRLALPLYNNEGMTSILVANLFFKDILEDLGKNKVDENTQYIFTNKKGEYLYHPNKSKIFAHEFSKNSSNLFQDYPKLAELVKSSKFGKSEEGYILDSASNLLWIQKFDLGSPQYATSLPTYQVAIIPHHVIASKLNSLWWLYVIGSSLGILILSFCTIWWLRLFFRPLDRLVNSIEDCKNISSSWNFNESGPLEVKVLAATLNELGRAIRIQADQIIDEKCKAEEALRARTEFLSRMSHEIRTPLNGVIGFTHLLKNQMRVGATVNEKMLDYRDKIDGASELLLNLINNVLDLAKFESGRMEVFLEKVEIRQCAKIAFEINQSVASEKHLSYEIFVEPSLSPYYKTDYSKFTQIITNLLGNAIKFTPEGQSVQLYLRKIDKGICIEVADTGIGIPKKQQKDIFRKFTQVDASVQRHHGGSGLGLSIVKHIVDQLGGSIELESEPGKGTHFFVHLPMEEIKDESKVEKSATDSKKFSSELKVLLVEDNELNQSLMADLLDEYGIKELTIASDGLEGFQEAIQQNYDLLLVDYHMPNCDGIECIKRIKSYWQINRIKEAPIVLVTADVTSDTKNLGQAVGIDDYISKPIDNEELQVILNKYLKYKNNPRTFELNKN